MLLHRLQQRGLGARARAVDFVGHQQLAEDRAGDEAEAALAAGALVQHLAAEDVGRHEIRGELDAAGIEPEHDAHALDQLGLGEAGKADQQRVAAAEHGDERLLDHAFLPEDHAADRGLGGGDLAAGRFRLAHDHVFELFQPFVGDRHEINSLLSNRCPAPALWSKRAPPPAPHCSLVTGGGSSPPYEGGGVSEGLDPHHPGHGRRRGPNLFYSWARVASAWRTIMSSSFSSPSLATAMRSAPCYLAVVRACYGPDVQSSPSDLTKKRATFGPLSHAAVDGGRFAPANPSQFMEITLFFTGCDPASAQVYDDRPRTRPGRKGRERLKF